MRRPRFQGVRHIFDGSCNILVPIIRPKMSQTPAREPLPLDRMELDQAVTTHDPVLYRLWTTEIVTWFRVYTGVTEHNRSIVFGVHRRTHGSGLVHDGDREIDIPAAVCAI